MTRPGMLRTRLAGLGAVLAITIFIVGVPLLLPAIGATPSPGTFTWTALTNPDDGTLALAVISAVAWLAWLVFTASIIVEAVARIRGLRPPRIPGLALPQSAANRLVTTAALLFVAVPSIAQIPTPRAEAHPVDPFPTTLVRREPVVPTAPEPAAAPTHADAATPDRQPTRPYRVRRGDSLWRIAEQQLGDGTRYTEIVALNTDVLNGRPDFITPGLDLLIPDEQHHPTQEPAATEKYVVEPGDTLSEIAQDELGDANAYPEIYAASEDTIQPGGAQLTDPNLILPGWILTIPDLAPQQREPDLRPTPRVREHGAGPDPAEAEPHAPTKPTTEPTTDPAPHQADHPTPETTPAVDEADDPSIPSWALPGLTGAGAILAGSLLLVLRRHRRTQLRYRRPGHVLSKPPDELVGVEKTAYLSGTVTTPYVEGLHALLRSLAESVDQMPRLQTVQIVDGSVTIHLAEPDSLPDPWRGQGRVWSAPLPKRPKQPEASAPYPLLVAVGQDDDGHPWLLNLEELKSVTVVGAGERIAAFGRYVAAELALNPWSTLVDIDALGIGSELAKLDPDRLHHHPDSDEAFLDRVAGDLDAGSRAAATEPDEFHAVLATRGHAEAVHRISKIVATHPGRAGAAVLVLAGDPAPGDAVLELGADGRLRATPLDLDVVAAGLTAEEAQACAAIVDVTREARSVPIPSAENAADGVSSVADAAGALRPEFTEARPDVGPAGETSLLPLTTKEYEEVGATTAEDIELLAPRVSPDVRRQVEDADPSLDDDLAQWLDPDARVPKLTLLGPVGARAHGSGTSVHKRKPFFTELLAYLCLHPNGVTSDQLMEDVRIRKDRIYAELSILRKWLGVDPGTGRHYLPTAPGGGRQKALYVVRGVLCDLDLFHRLRKRGEARGAEGITDLTTALQLVGGEPFSHLRPAGWNWLLEGQRLDHIATCGVVDVAHIVTTHALATGDHHLARVSAEIGYAAAPDDEVSTLDLIAVAHATGHADLANKQLIERVLDRSDDHLGPIDLPTRTAKIVRQCLWNGGLRPDDE